MKALTLLLLTTAYAARILGASECVLPRETVAPLEAELRYQNGLHKNRRVVKRFSVALIDGTTVFRSEYIEPSVDSSQRLIYVLSKSHRLDRTSCPADSTWLDCVKQWLRDPTARPPYTAEAPKQPTCQLNLVVPPWTPSPNNEQKHRVVTELLKELHADQAPRPKAVYARDFNLKDPEIDFYVVDADGAEEFHGCSFDITRLPYCWQHGYGQTPVDWLKRNVLARPYRLYPAPIGPVQGALDASR